MSQIPLFGKYGAGKFAYVDKADYELLNQYKWHVDRGGYVCRGKYVDGKCTTIFMHRAVMGFPEGKVIDHKDRNKLNNTRENLRIVTNDVNLLNAKLRDDNKYGMKNVYYDKRRDKYAIKMRWRGKQYSGGYHKTLPEAAAALDDLKLKIYGFDLYVEIHS